ncbi:hypothetical protein GN956_G24801 [Arapaima gigas]
MGNSFASAVDKWSLNPRKLSKKTRRKKGAPVDPPCRSDETHTYDTVAEVPVYAVPNKKRRPQEEIHYAEVEVLQSHSTTSRSDHSSVPSRTGTEYATIDFQAKQATPCHNGSIKATVDQKPADILIPPGGFKKPVPQPRLKKALSQKSHGP